jgi:hypothetical protein
VSSAHWHNDRKHIVNDEEATRSLIFLAAKLTVCAMPPAPAEIPAGPRGGNFSKLHRSPSCLRFMGASIVASPSEDWFGFKEFQVRSQSYPRALDFNTVIGLTCSDRLFCT